MSRALRRKFNAISCVLATAQGTEHIPTLDVPFTADSFNAPLRSAVRITPHSADLNPRWPAYKISAESEETVPISWNFAKKKK